MRLSVRGFESSRVVYEDGDSQALTGQGSTTRDDHRINLKEVPTTERRRCGGY